MAKIHYMKDTKAFWQEREKSRSALDKKRRNMSFSKKVKYLEKLRSDLDFLKSGRLVSPKP